MVYKIECLALVGLEPYPVTCEVDLSPQLPALSLVGLPSSITQESRERIRSAVANAGLEWPARKITINLLPANLPKWGSHFELAMALGVLAAGVENLVALPVLALGELSLTGEVRPCGWLPAVAVYLMEAARETRASGATLLLIAHERDVAELADAEPRLATECELAGVRALSGALEALHAAAARAAEARSAKSGTPGEAATSPAAGASAVPRADVPAKQARGQAGPIAAARDFATLAAVREEPLGVVAALAAVAGGHHCLFAGPHGMGKSMLVRGICEAAGPLTYAQSAERDAVLRTFGVHFGADARARGCARPVASLQASITRAALEGALLSTGQVLPGELTRAHLGLVVADELLEYRREVIEAFRQPLEEGLVRLQRARFRASLPARFQLLASTNLCGCGFFGLARRLCRCQKMRRESYQARLSGPILDRFDLIVAVGAGRARGGAIRQVEVPLDLEPLVARLTDPARWPEMLARGAVRGQQTVGTTGPSLAADTVPSPTGATGSELWPKLWGELDGAISERGRLKIARVARTLAHLLGEPRELKHMRLALLVRQDLDLLLRSQFFHVVNRKAV